MCDKTALELSTVMLQRCPGLQIFLSRCNKHACLVHQQMSHYNDFNVVFLLMENENGDVEMIIPTNRESKCNHNICQNNRNVCDLILNKIPAHILILQP